MKIVVLVLMLFDDEEHKWGGYLRSWKNYNWIFATNTKDLGCATFRMILFMNSEEVERNLERLSEIKIRPVKRLEYEVEESDPKKVDFHNLLTQTLRDM